MSLIGLLTATEKQVHLGRLHMRPIQWHLKNNWRVPESLEKVIPVPRSLHPHLRWWLEESNVLQGQPLHPLKHALQIFTDASKEGWGAHLNKHSARETWSLPESKLHINHLELKAVFLALKEFQDLCSNNIVLVATNNTTVVAYINKELGMKSGSLCALLWRILSWCTRKQVTLKARHIPGRLNVIADKLSRLGQTIQTEWSLYPEVFQVVFSKYPFWWDRVGIDFSGRVPEYSRRWAIIGDSTKISTFTNLKHIMGSNHLLCFSSATFFAFKTVRHRRNVNQEKFLCIQNTVVSIKVELHDLSVKHSLLL